jgi:hypothetical protein
MIKPIEISRPIIRPGGQKLDAFAVALHQHQLERDHAGTAVVQIWNPIVPCLEKPREPLISVIGELGENDFLRQVVYPTD